MSTKPPRSANPLETLTREIGREFADTAKQTVKETVNALSPTEFLKSIYGVTAETSATPEAPEGASHTPLNVEQLKQKHAAQKNDEAELTALRNQYFATVNRESANARQQIKEEGEQKAHEEQAAQQERLQLEQLAHAQTDAAPVGKERRSILGGKKKKTSTAPAPHEVKANKGK